MISLTMILFSAYWPRGDAANAANLFAASGFGLPPHPGMPFGMLPPGAAAAAAAAAAASSGRMSSYPSAASVATSSSASQHQAYSNAAFTNAAAYTNTLSVAASQAASLGIPAASKYIFLQIYIDNTTHEKKIKNP